MSCLLRDVFDKRDWDIIWLSELDNVHGELTFLDELVAELEPHAFHRHYGGEGNTACGFLIHYRLCPLLRRVEWHNRSGALILQSPGSVPLVVAGVHGHMHSEANRTLSELAALLGLCPGDERQVCMIGDWNIDVSSRMPGFVDTEGNIAIRRNAPGPRDRLHSSNSGHTQLLRAKLLLESWALNLRCEICIAESCDLPPGGPFLAQCIAWPFTRIPVGEHADTHTPSLLDYAIVSIGACRQQWLDWEAVPADHGAIGVLCGLELCYTHPTKDSLAMY